jgi:FkbM family methyltransferase
MSGIKNKIRGFLYRRLAGVVSCQIRLPFGEVMLTDKWNVASFQDVFLHPFYWQIADLVSHPPKLIMDCGAHCGHFSILAETCIRARFDSSVTKYVLIEPNPNLQRTLESNLSNAGILDRSLIVNGAVGIISSTCFLDLRDGNFLSARTASAAVKGSVQVQGVLPSEVSLGTIDILKVDIEGAEATLFDCDPNLLSKVNILLLEWHAQVNDRRKHVMTLISDAGLNPIGKSYSHFNHELMAFSR